MSMHTFEISGLGKAPFVVVQPKINAMEANLGRVWYCEHCGTTIKNRHFIKSADGKIFTVGIDCLRKTGDQGLIEGEKRLRSEAKTQLRMVAIEDRLKAIQDAEREVNGGLTNQELAEKRDALAAELRKKYVGSIDKNELVQAMGADIGNSFLMSMRFRAFSGEPYTPKMLEAIKKFYIKELKKHAGVNDLLALSNSQVGYLQAEIQQFKEALTVIRLG